MVVWFSLACVLFLSCFVKSIRESASQSLDILSGLIMCCHQLGFLQADPETEFLVQDDLGDHYLCRGGRWSRAASIPCWLLVKSGWKKCLDACPWLPSSWGLWGVQWSWSWHWGLLTYAHGSPTMTFVSGQIWEISAVQIKTDCGRALRAPLWGQEPGAVPGESVSWTTPCLHIPTAPTQAHALSVKRVISEKEQWCQSGDFQSAVQTRPRVT